MSEVDWDLLGRFLCRETTLAEDEAMRAWLAASPEHWALAQAARFIGRARTEPAPAEWKAAVISLLRHEGGDEAPEGTTEPPRLDVIRGDGPASPRHPVPMPHGSKFNSSS